MRRSPKNRLVKLILYIILGLIGVLLISNKFSKKELISPLSTKKIPLKNSVEEALAGTKGIYGVVVKNLKTGESYYLNEHRIFKAGSLYKLWIMAAVYKNIQNGELTEDKQLSQEVEILNDKFNIDDEVAELTEGTVSMTVGDALKQMITISHNYAALLLTENIKLSIVAKYLKEWEFNESKTGTDGDDPVTTAFDIALFFEKLYKLELADKENTDKMTGLLQNQQNNDKLPKYLPEDIKIAHKTGELGWFSHDGGIVYSPKGDYVIVVLSESGLPIGAKERIAEVSKAVYKYFN